MMRLEVAPRDPCAIAPPHVISPEGRHGGRRGATGYGGRMLVELATRLSA
jgi:hypothetical protein